LLICWYAIVISLKSNTSNIHTKLICWSLHNPKIETNIYLLNLINLNLQTLPHLTILKILMLLEI